MALTWLAMYVVPLRTTHSLELAIGYVFRPVRAAGFYLNT